MKESLWDSLLMLAVALLVISLCFLAVPLAVLDAWREEWVGD